MRFLLDMGSIRWQAYEFNPLLVVSLVTTNQGMELALGSGVSW
jgi:hypothetical protein